MSYDVENRMTSMTTAGGTTTFGYNGDGTRVSRTVAAGTTYYIGNYYEVWKPSGTATINKYYYFGANRVAANISGTLFYMQGDHLGSSTLMMTTGGALQTRQSYFPYGDKRVADGSALPTGMDYTFTGQKSDDSTGLMFYGARYYDTTLGRFTQADTIVPGAMNPQSLNRYAYVLNNPVRYTDPTGHKCEDGDLDCGGGGSSGGSQDPCAADPTAQGCPGYVDPTPYCDKYPEANGCAKPPADSGGNQDPDTGDGEKKQKDDNASADVEEPLLGFLFTHRQYTAPRGYCEIACVKGFVDTEGGIEGRLVNLDYTVDEGLSGALSIGPFSYDTSEGLGVRNGSTTSYFNVKSLSMESIDITAKTGVTTKDAQGITKTVYVGQEVEEHPGIGAAAVVVLFTVQVEIREMNLFGGDPLGAPAGAGGLMGPLNLGGGSSLIPD